MKVCSNVLTSFAFWKQPTGSSGSSLCVQPVRFSQYFLNNLGFCQKIYYIGHSHLCIHVDTLWITIKYSCSLQLNDGMRESPQRNTFWFSRYVIHIFKFVIFNLLIRFHSSEFITESVEVLDRLCSVRCNLSPNPPHLHNNSGISNNFCLIWLHIQKTDFLVTVAACGNKIRKLEWKWNEINTIQVDLFIFARVENSLWGYACVPEQMIMHSMNAKQPFRLDNCYINLRWRRRRIKRSDISRSR